MGKGSGNGMTRGDRKRNARRDRLRGLLPRDGVVVGIDLAEDKQALAVIDHDVRVLARKSVKVKAFRLGEALDWAVAQARAKGFTSVTVACEPTGPRWMQVQRLYAERGLPLVCIQPLMSHIARAAPPVVFVLADLGEVVGRVDERVRRRGPGISFVSFEVELAAQVVHGVDPPGDHPAAGRLAGSGRAGQPPAGAGDGRGSRRRSGRPGPPSTARSSTPRTSRASSSVATHVLRGDLGRVDLREHVVVAPEPRLVRPPSRGSLTSKPPAVISTTWPSSLHKSTIT